MAKSFPVLAHKKVLAVIVASQSQMAIGKAKEGALFRVNLLFLGEQHVNPGINQKRPEKVHDPRKSFDQFRARKDHYAAHHQRAEDSPFQHAVLESLIDRKGAEDHQKQEKVVDAEGLLDQIAGKKFDRVLIAREVPNAEARTAPTARSTASWTRMLRAVRPCAGGG